MKKGLIISDTGPIISLATIDKLKILNSLFDEVFIPKAVWEELTRDDTKDFNRRIFDYFKDKIKEISVNNELAFIMDYGESEAVKLYKELNADFLLIDDKKARKLAENFDIKCVGTIGILSIAKENGVIDKLHPLFETFLKNKRFYSIKLLNSILKKYGEPEIEKEV